MRECLIRRVFAVIRSKAPVIGTPETFEPTWVYLALVPHPVISYIYASGVGRSVNAVSVMQSNSSVSYSKQPWKMPLSNFPFSCY